MKRSPIENTNISSVIWVQVKKILDFFFRHSIPHMKMSKVIHLFKVPKTSSVKKKTGVKSYRRRMMEMCKKKSVKFYMTSQRPNEDDYKESTVVLTGKKTTWKNYSRGNHSRRNYYRRNYYRRNYYRKKTNVEKKKKMLKATT